MTSWNLIYLAPISALLSLLFAAFLAASVLKQDEGTEKMRQISAWVREGSQAYIRRQTTAVSIFFGIVFLVLLVLSWRGYLNRFVPFGFLRDSFCFIYLIRQVFHNY